MPRSLDASKLSDALASSGLSQAGLAKQLGVTRAAVSKWFRGESFPRPDKLLKIALAVGLPYDELVCEAAATEPIVAFRKKGARKTTQDHIDRAKDMGRQLQRLVPYLPFDNLRQHPSLREPVTDYDYLQRVARDVRQEIGVPDKEPVEFHALVQRFEQFSVVLIPVMWGHKEAHENALHIRLPESDTTWIFLNLDSQSHDFNFWISHELGHVISPSLTGNDAEDFADRFAGALLFPEDCAAQEFPTLQRRSNAGSIINHMRRVAERFGVSPITIFEEIDNYARAHGEPPVGLEKQAIYPAATNFNKRYYTIRETFFDAEEPTAASYIKKTEEIFRTPFFDALSAYLRESEAGAGYVHAILNTSLVDAKAIAAELG